MNVALSKSRPTDTQPGAVAGQENRAAQARPNYSAMARGRTPLTARGTKFEGGSKFEPTTEKRVAEDLSIALAEYSVGQIAQAAQCTKDAAKSWKKGRRAPRSSHLLNMAALLPRIADYVEKTAGARLSPPSASIIDQKSIAAFIGIMQVAAQSPGEGGAQARAALTAMMTVANAGDEDG